MKILIFVLIFFSVIELQTQEAKNTFIVSGILAHYGQISKYRKAKYVYGYYLYPVDPGVEVLYLRNLNNNIFLGTGVCYQKGKIMDFIINQYRFHFTEVSIPVLLSRSFNFDKKKWIINYNRVVRRKNVSPKSRKCIKSL